MPTDPADRMHDVLERAYGSARRSPQRDLIAHSVEALPGAFSVEELLAHVRAIAPGVGAATVYRAVACMVERGHLEPVGERAGSSLYVRCAEPGHHHHLVCTGCGSVTDTPCPLDDAAIAAASERGFVITHHEVSVYGLCARCLRTGVASGVAEEAGR